MFSTLCTTALVAALQSQMRYISCALVLIAGLMLSTPAARAMPITFVADLTQALEVPPTGSPGTGSATIVLDTTANTMHVHVTFSGLTSGTTASHIHHASAGLKWRSQAAMDV